MVGIMSGRGRACILGVVAAARFSALRAAFFALLASCQFRFRAAFP
jgi:hypothetical protein